MKNIHLIPTEKQSRLRIGNNGNFVFGIMQTYIQSRNDFYTNHHIYITSEEDIKDWFLTKDGSLLKRTDDDTDLGLAYLGSKKIILTTDPDLIADGVQAIDDEFLEWFVKNPSCEEVEVESFVNGNVERIYEIIIPQEEPNQEIIATEEDAKIFVDTIENPPAPNEKLKTAFEKAMTSSTKNEAAEKWCSEEGFYPDPKQGFIAGAKWQSERMYSEEEVLEHLNHLIMMPSSKLDKFTNDEEMVTMKWFNQFKKK